MHFAFFNPHLQNEADFLASFVARREVLDYYLRQLRVLAPDQPGRHHLMVAPRGYGKTSMLRRIAIAVRTEHDLAARFIALTFREEQHNVISLDVFWRNCLQSLLEAREDEHASQDEIDELDAAWEKHAPRQALTRDDQDGDPAWRDFAGRCKRLGRRALLLIDNLDSLLDGLPPKHQWALRGILQQPDGPVLIAAASRFPDSVHDPKAAFHDFFRIDPLDKLSDQEVLTCLRALAAKRGPAGQPVMRMLDENPGRVASLNALAGGNPRTLSVLYSVLESHMSADVLSQLSAMLDTFTSWYQSRAEALPSQARAVFDALALNWNPMTAAAVGTVTGLDTTAVSSQISRLEKAGLVESVPLTRGRGRSGYQLSERFFNIWYLMRNGPRRSRQSIRFLAVFLQSCYSPAERRALAQAVMTKGDAHSGYALGLAASLQSRTLRARLLDLAEKQAALSGTTDEYAEAIAELRSEVGRKTSSAKPQKPRDVATLDRDIARLQRTRRDDVRLAATLHEKADRLYAEGRAREALAVLDTIGERFGDAPTPQLREIVARALYNQGVVLAELGETQQAIATYDALLSRFAEDPAPPLRERVAEALLNKAVNLARIGQIEQAIATYDTIIERFADDPAPPLREQVARALFNKAIHLATLGQTEQAIATYDTIVDRFAEDPAPPLREQVAKALLHKAIDLATLGQTEQAIATYDTIVDRFAEDPAPPLREQVAKAFLNKAVNLARIGQIAQAIATYDTITDRFADDSAPSLREQVAKALFNKAVNLARIGQIEQAIVTYDTIVDRFAEDPASPLREPVAKALFNKAVNLARIGQIEQAIATYDTIVDRFAEDPAPPLREQIAKALLNKAVNLARIGQIEQAIATYDTIIHRFADDSAPSLREQVGKALFNKAVNLARIGQIEQAIVTYDTIVDRFAEDPAPPLRERVAKALLNKAIDLAELGQIEQSIATYDSIVNRFAEDPAPPLREQVAKALLYKAIDLAELGHIEQAIATYDSIVDRFADDPAPSLREVVSMALLNKGMTLIKADAPQKAEETLRAAAGFGIGETSAKAWNSLGNLLLDRVGDPQRALAAFESGLNSGTASEEWNAILHANSAYAAALHDGDLVRARQHRDEALRDGSSLSAAGRALLAAIDSIDKPKAERWEAILEAIGQAAASGDESLWSNYLDDLQRWIAYLLADGGGERVREWMIDAQFPLKYAPLYHAVVAAIEGEDALLRINPETRGAAENIYEGIARRVRLYAQRKPADRKRRVGARSRS